MTRSRTLILVTALFSSLIGGVVVYLAISVPNDLRADALLNTARKDIEAGRNDQARAALSKVIQQYPRTDAAGAATVALVSMATKDRDSLTRSITHLRKAQAAQNTTITGLKNRIAELEKPPPPPPPVVKPAAKKAPIVIRRSPVRKPPARRRR